MPVLLSGRTQDYIRCAVREYGPLIFVLASATCGPEYINAIRPRFVMSNALYREFNAGTCEKLLRAWSELDRAIPLVCDTAATEYMAYGQPELDLDVRDLYILG